MKIKLPLCMRVQPYEWQVVDAELVDVAPHITVGTFAVHRAVGAWLLVWSVTNVETGQRVASGRTRAQAIKFATEMLAEKNDAAVKAGYRTSHRATRRSPSTKRCA